LKLNQVFVKGELTQIGKSVSFEGQLLIFVRFRIETRMGKSRKLEQMCLHCCL